MLKFQSSKWKLPIALFGVWTLLGLIFAGISYLAGLNEEQAVNFWAVFSTNLLRFYIWAALSPLIYLVVRRFDFTHRNSALRGLLTYLPLGVFLSIIHGMIYTGIVWVTVDLYRTRYVSIAKFFHDYVLFGSLYLGILLYTLIVIAMHAWLLLRRYQAEESRNSRLQAQLAEAELQALKMQLQPHFLFNTLHSISSLNLIDPQKANLMIARLGDFLRMTLDRSGEQLVNLSEELSFLKCYLEIEQIRFSDRLMIEFDVADETLAAEIPHLILQPVVENSVKHGIAPRSATGLIRIGSRRQGDSLILTIADNGAGTNEDADQDKGTGLKNVRARLAQIYGENFTFELKNGNGMTVTFELPFSTSSPASPKNRRTANENAA